MVGFWRRGEDDELDDEIAGVLGVTQKNVHEKLYQIPELEKSIKSLVTSNIPHDDVAKRHALPELKEHGGDRKSGEINQVDVCQVENQGGNSAEYRARKLKRDHPDVFQQKQNPHHVGNPGGGRLRR